jgi:hypothetical protein
MNALALNLAFLIVVYFSCVEYSLPLFHKKFRFIVDATGHKKAPQIQAGLVLYKKDVVSILRHKMPRHWCYSQ